MPLNSGQRLGAYEILSSLGSGGMGEVYRARDSRLGRDVALKVLPAEVTNEPGRLERFDREARAIAALNHPHIVTIYSTEEADGMRFLTMELVDGCTLGDLIVPSGMAIPKFLEIALPLADALAAAHQKQITHRDLKPGNVMVSNDGRVKVLDFGLARVGGADIGEQTLIATQPPITHQGMIVGTMPYMSPEQVEGKPLDPRSDLFSLGVIFYELLSGSRPFSGSSSPALMSAILRDTPSSVCEKRPEVPESIDRLIARLLEKRPEDRVQTARDVFNELKHIRSDKRSDGRSDGRSDTRSTHDNLRIAVLPFTVRGADADAEAMAAGLTDDITTSLGKFPGLTVVASQTTRAFKDSPLDVRDISVRIGARYIISGHVRKSGPAIRTTGQLIDAKSGAQLWTENYDRRIDNGADLFTTQDDIVDHIVATLADQGGTLAQSMMLSVPHESIGGVTPERLIVRMWSFQHEPAPAKHAELRAGLEQQLEHDSNNADLWAMLSNLYICEHSLMFNPLPDSLGRAVRAARRAIEIDRGNQSGWLWLGQAHFYLRDRPGMEEAFDRVMRINPRNARAMAWVGGMLTHAGDYERGTKLTARAMQINPAHPGWVHISIFNRHFAEGNFEAALQSARRVNIPNFFWMHFTIAAAAGHLGRIDEGHQAAETMARIQPAVADQAHLREFITRWYWPEEMIESLLDGVRRSINASDTQEERPRSGSTSKPRSDIRHVDPSIAVMPFTDLSEKKDQDWFCDGIAEEILNALAPLPGLRVAARASAFSLRGKTDDLRSIGEKLDVTTVLEGSVRRAGDRVRITAQLSDAQQGRQLWSERFDRELEDIFDVQEQIARAIVDRLRVTISGMPERLVPQATANVEAYQLLLKGRVFLNRRGPAIANAISCFKQALALDPNLADAHAGLGDTYRLFGIYGLLPAREALPPARESLERALAIDREQVEALATLANITHAFEWDYREGRVLTDRALARDPSHVRALAESAIMIATAKAEPSSEALNALVLERVRHARSLDPLNAWTMAIEGMVLLILGHPQEAIDIAARAVAADSTNFTAHWSRVFTLAALDRVAEADAAADAALAMSRRHPMVLAELATLHARNGNRARAIDIYRELADRAGAGFVSPGSRACAAAAAGEIDDATRLLAQAIAERDVFLTFYKLPAWRAIWDIPHCAALLRASKMMQNCPS
jgi:TolB-like protein/Tfp pilus assembly protein PilF